MQRLTTNKAINKMDATELAHNSCYKIKRHARYRDHKRDIDAVRLAMELYTYYCDEDFENIDDEDFDCWLDDYTQYPLDSLDGLIASFYTQVCAMADLHEKLKTYEDLEEQRKLLKLPLTVGNTLYYPDNEYYFDVLPVMITEIAIGELNTLQFIGCSFDGNGDPKIELEFKEDDFDKTIFINREDAENRLKEIMNPAESEYCKDKQKEDGNVEFIK